MAEKRKKNKNKAKKNKDGKTKGKASFRKKGKRHGLKAPSPIDRPEAATHHESDSEKIYKGFDLSELPKEAYPDKNRTNKGRLSYTIEFSGARVEILLDKKAYFIKKIAAGSPGPAGQITWSKFNGPVEAWNLVKSRSGLNRPADTAS